MKNIEKYQSLLETGEVDALLLTTPGNESGNVTRQKL